MNLWLKWWCVFLVYLILNYLSVWMPEKPGVMTYFSWGSTLPIAAITVWSALLLPRRRILRFKRILGILTVIAYGLLGVLSNWTVWSRMVVAD